MVIRTAGDMAHHHMHDEEAEFEDEVSLRDLLLLAVSKTLASTLASPFTTTKVRVHTPILPEADLKHTNMIVSSADLFKRSCGRDSLAVRT